VSWLALFIIALIAVVAILITREPSHTPDGSRNDEL
jgi:hypothetical protein